MHATSCKEGQRQSDQFDFDVWLKDNELSVLKETFLKHGLSEPANLCTNSSSFTSFISDPILYSNHAALISKAVVAIQHFAKRHGHAKTANTPQTSGGKAKTKASKRKPIVVISETEQKILNTLQSSLKDLDATKERISASQNEEAVDSTETYHLHYARIESIKDKVCSFFDDVQKRLNRKQTSLLNQLNTLQQNIPKECNQTTTSTRQTIASWLVGIETLQKTIQENLEACDRILRSTCTTTTREQRKQRIIELNNAVMSKYELANQQLQRNLSLFENNQQLKKTVEYVVDFSTDSKHAKCLLLDIDILALSMHADKHTDDDDDMKLGAATGATAAPTPLNGMPFRLQTTPTKGVLHCVPMLTAATAVPAPPSFDAQRMAECLVPNQHIIENLDYRWKYVRAEGRQCSSGEVYFEVRVLCSVLGASNLTTIQIGWCMPPGEDIALCDEFEYVVIGNRLCAHGIAGTLIHKRPFEISQNSELEVGFGAANDCVCCLANFERHEFTFWINGKRCKVLQFPVSFREHAKPLTPVIGLSKASVQLNFRKLQCPIPQLILSPNTCAMHDYMASKRKRIESMQLNECNALLDTYRMQNKCDKAKFWLNRVGPQFGCTFVLDGKRIVHHSADADGTAALLLCVREFVETYVEHTAPVETAAESDVTHVMSPSH